MWWLIEPRRERVEVATEAGATLVCESSLKAALDGHWDRQQEKEEALDLVLNVLRAVEMGGQTLHEDEAQLAQSSLLSAQQVKAQEVEVTEQGEERLMKGVAKDRRISVEDDQMRHGRKRRRLLIDGYKRHVLHDLDTGLIRAGGRTPATVPEASVTEAISEDLSGPAVCFQERHRDRASVSSHLVQKRSNDLDRYCQAWPVRESTYVPKQAFTRDGERQIIRCPAEQEMPFVPGGVVPFPKDTCARCPLTEPCTTSAQGRSVSIHPEEALLIAFRQRQQTAHGRRTRRERVAVEQTLAHVGQWQGRRARSRGVRKKLFDLRRCAVVHNLHVLARSQMLSAELHAIA